jgi:multicomponent Na+:H+ antiporter subunit D
VTVLPALVLLGGAAGAALVSGRAQRLFTLGAPLLALAAVVWMPEGAHFTLGFLGKTLHPLRADALSHLFALVFCAIALIGQIYALHLRARAEHAATLAYAAGALGVVFAGDWLTLFFFWELMAVASAVVVFCGGGPRAGAAGMRYLLVHALGGGLLLAGILVHLSRGGGLELDARIAAGAPFWLILSAFAVNAAIPPLHAWLTDAYPEASVTGTIFLSALTTKTAVYALLRVFPGTEALVALGVAMALYGVVYAVLENDIRRLLAYHIVSQVGYMVAGVGMGGAMAESGAAAHAFCHILYKALLLMGAGAVLQATSRRKLTELGGLGRALPWVTALYMVGAFSISGAPLFNGFVSKSIIVSAAAEGGRPGAELLLTLASVGTFLHTGLKLPWFTFFGEERKIEAAPLPRNMFVAMGLAAAACVGLGLYPQWLYARLPHPIEYAPYTVDHVTAALQLLLGTAAAFFLLLPKLAGEPTVSLDTDFFYRRPLRAALVAAARAFIALGAGAQGARARAVARLAGALGAPGRLAPLGFTLAAMGAAAGLLALWLWAGSR